MGELFSCRLCGECCSGEMKVFLNPEDLELIKEYTGMSSVDELFAAKLLTWDEKSGTRQPRLLFRCVSGVKFCPFLENRLEDDGSLRGLCRLHPHYKPLVCHLAPLTREIDFEADSEVYGFIPPHQDCPGCRLPDGEGEELSYDDLPDDLKKRLAREKEYFRSIWLAPDD